LNYFYTTLLAEDGQLLQVPNNHFFQKTVRRRPGASPAFTLVQQLHSPTAAALPPPPPSLQSKDQPATKSTEPNPLMSVPDPATLSPRMPGR
jgi:hypothetical protein